MKISPDYAVVMLVTDSLFDRYMDSLEKVTLCVGATHSVVLSLIVATWMPIAVKADIPLPVTFSLYLYASYYSASECDQRRRRNSGSRSSATRQSRLVQDLGAIYKGSRCLESNVSYHAMCLDIKCALLFLTNVMIMLVRWSLKERRHTS